jgi:hypothetical protein
MEQRSLKWMEYALWVGGGVLMVLELLIMLSLAAVG